MRVYRNFPSDKVPPPMKKFPPRSAHLQKLQPKEVKGWKSGVQKDGLLEKWPTKEIFL